MRREVDEGIHPEARIALCRYTLASESLPPGTTGGRGEGGSSDVEVEIPRRRTDNRGSMTETPCIGGS